MGAKVKSIIIFLFAFIVVLIFLSISVSAIPLTGCYEFDSTWANAVYLNSNLPGTSSTIPLAVSGFSSVSDSMLCLVLGLLGREPADSCDPPCNPDEMCIEGTCVGPDTTPVTPGGDACQTTCDNKYGTSPRKVGVCLAKPVISLDYSPGENGGNDGDFYCFGASARAPYCHCLNTQEAQWVMAFPGRNENYQHYTNECRLLCNIYESNDLMWHGGATPSITGGCGINTDIPMPKADNWCSQSGGGGSCTCYKSCTQACRDSGKSGSVTCSVGGAVAPFCGGCSGSVTCFETRVPAGDYSCLLSGSDTGLCCCT